MPGRTIMINGMRCSKGGHPICRRCQKIIVNDTDFDAEMERMHKWCADEKRIAISKREAAIPAFKTLEAEYAYNREQTMMWLFLCEPW